MSSLGWSEWTPSANSQPKTLTPDQLQQLASQVVGIMNPSLAQQQSTIVPPMPAVGTPAGAKVRKPKAPSSTAATSGSVADAAPGGGNNPHHIPDFVLRSMGLDAEQVSTIMSLIGGPEQSNVQWWKGVNGKSVYGYCENINDGRGVTMGMAGFVSKFGELDRVFKEYGVDRKTIGDPNDCKPKKGCKLCDWIEARGEDQKWIDAQWKRYHAGYMVHVPKFIPKQFADNALIKGLLLDTAMNSGIGSEGNAWGMDKLAKTAKGSTPLDWVNNFCDLRFDHFAAGNTDHGKKGRLLTWRTLAKEGKWDLKGVDPCKYAFCYAPGPKLGMWCKGCK